MDLLERNVMRECNTLLVDNLDAKDIAPCLFSKRYLNDNHMEEIFSDRYSSRNKICQIFLLTIVKTCSFKVFLSALRLQDQYIFLADKLEECMSQKKTLERQHGNETDSVEQSEGQNKVEAIAKQVDKISISSTHKRKIAIIAHELKKLSHDGKMEKLKKHTQLILNNFKMKKVSVIKQMELADLAFTALEAEVIARRVKYDVTLYGSQVYDNMKSLIPFTTNPTTSSMTFLSR